MAEVLVTGGAGYIGAHCCVTMIRAGLRPIIFDNFSNSSMVVIDRIAELTGLRPAIVHGDVRDKAALDQAFKAHAPAAVIHFAAYKSVAESVADPLAYYDNNLGGTLCLLDAMRRHGTRMLVFSSSATVYGEPESVSLREDAPCRPVSPYGRSKHMAEHVLEDLERSEPGWRIARLRYFNPVGAHESGRIGENPRGIPNNLVPFMAQVAMGQRTHLSVFGNDYPTPDGTGVRDYIHVMDLAEGHLAALRYLQDADRSLTVNLGTGRGVSVMEMIRAFERASGRPIPHVAAPRRPGDIAQYYADPALANQLLGWKAHRSVDEMCADAWRWQLNNPEGYE